MITFVNMKLSYSFVVPVYNRPDETQELLESLVAMTTNIPFEVVIVEDGSSTTSKDVVDSFSDQLDIQYFFKANSGPGPSRNYGMERASGNYFIILDSDCIMPPQYLDEVDKSLKEKYVDCYGGPDSAHESFTGLQKAINFAMTSFITTGGIRGGKKRIGKFQPRSFNLGLSKVGFEKTGEFGKIHPGEDPDLSIRLWNLGFETKLIPEAYVFHKRRISWSKFYKQVNKFGLVRPILNDWYPETKKLTYWFPTVFIVGLFISVIAALMGNYIFISLYGLYYAFAFITAIMSTKSLSIAAMSLFAITIQFWGYGRGFIKSWMDINILKKNIPEDFPKLFFK